MGVEADAIALVQAHGEQIVFDRMSFRQIRRAFNVSERVALRAIALARDTVRPPQPLQTIPDPVPPNEAISASPVLDLQQDGTATLSKTSPNAVIETPEQLIAAAGLDMTRWEITSSKVNTWPVATKDPSGEVTVTRLWQVRVDLRPRTIPAIPPDWGRPPPFERRVEPSPGDQCVVLPDMQIGYRWRLDPAGRSYLDPFHDRSAIDAALQLVADVAPSDVILLGDNLDLSAMSMRWTVEDSVRQTLHPALLETRWLLWRLRSIVPKARITYFAGNHEDRLGRLLSERAPELVGATLPDGTKALSLAAWIGCEALGIDWVPYPENRWLWDRVFVEHGRIVGSGSGSTAAKLARFKGNHSHLQGHIHRIEIAQSTYATPKGHRTVWSGSVGCLCRLDGAVPGSPTVPNWQQGVGVIVADHEGGEDEIHPIRIRGGRLTWGGRVLTGRDYAAELAGAANFEALLPSGD